MIFGVFAYFDLAALTNKRICFTLIVIMVEKIGDGRKSDVTYPSEDNMKVKIIIPAEFFKTRGRGK